MILNVTSALIQKWTNSHDRGIQSAWARSRILSEAAVTRSLPCAYTEAGQLKLKDRWINQPAQVFNLNERAKRFQNGEDVRPFSTELAAA